MHAIVEAADLQDSDGGALLMASLIRASSPFRLLPFLALLGGSRSFPSGRNSW
jgi:hypothetical protein